MGACCAKKLSEKAKAMKEKLDSNTLNLDITFKKNSEELEDGEHAEGDLHTLAEVMGAESQKLLITVTTECKEKSIVPGHKDTDQRNFKDLCVRRGGEIQKFLISKGCKPAKVEVDQPIFEDSNGHRVLIRKQGQELKK